MDIIDIILASKKSFTGETESLIRQAKEAMAQANEVSAILQDAQEANAAAQTANEAAQEAQARAEAIADDFDELKSDFTSAAATLTNEIVEDKIQEALTPIQTDITSLENTVEDNYVELSTAIQQAQSAAANSIDVSVQDNNTTSAKIKKAVITKNGNSTSYDIEKNYTSTGNNEDGSMTQKAITAYVNSIKADIERELENYTPSEGGSGSNLNPSNAGNIVVVGEDGHIIAGSTSEEDIIAALIKAGTYTVNDALGLEIDYSNKVFTRTQDAISKTDGTDFNQYPMFGGRMRCNVLDDGTISAFYGDSNYKEDGSNGQVMVYQPKFYYQRIPITTSILDRGQVIKKESLIITSKHQSGFKLHPMFINEDGEEIDYVLLPAYEGSIYDTSTANYDTTSTLTIDFANDKLSSIAQAKPIGGGDNILTVATAERLANNRGKGWHITNMAAESVNQMLLIIEYGQLNAQAALESGIVNIQGVTGRNCASITGSTSTLGNTSGAADSTTNEINGSYTEYNVAGQRAISYRGMENPWGNIWHFIGGVNIYGQGHDDGGYPYFCKDFNYEYDTITDNYANIGFKIPAVHSWISGMGYGNTDYDWVFMPAECANANSALPVGDSFWSNPILNGINCVAVGGTWESEDSGGPFYYGCDREITYSKPSFGAKLMFIPKKNNIYTENITKWTNKFGGD